MLARDAAGAVAAGADAEPKLAEKRMRMVVNAMVASGYLTEREAKALAHAGGRRAHAQRPSDRAPTSPTGRCRKRAPLDRA